MSPTNLLYTLFWCFEPCRVLYCHLVILWSFLLALLWCIIACESSSCLWLVSSFNFSLFCTLFLKFLVKAFHFLLLVCIFLFLFLCCTLEYVASVRSSDFFSYFWQVEVDIFSVMFLMEFMKLFSNFSLSHHCAWIWIIFVKLNFLIKLIHPNCILKYILQFHHYIGQNWYCN